MFLSHVLQTVSRCGAPPGRRAMVGPAPFTFALVHLEIGGDRRSPVDG
jgi:hypothetical protein